MTRRAVVAAAVVSVVAFVVLSFSATAGAELAAVGPASPQTGFPTFYTDMGGTSVELCLEGDGLTGMCLFDPVVPGNAFSAQVGFGAEAFYWSADALMTIAPGGALPTGGGALLVLALEAAWVNEDPIDGDQFPFGRIRVRFNAPVAGDYTIIHPFGSMTFNDVIAGEQVRESVDIGAPAPNFEVALLSGIGPFLRAETPAPPAGFLGDPGIDQTVTGSPTGNNFFRLEGPAGSNLDGLGNDFIQTNMFSVFGKIFTGVAQTPMTVDRTTYKLHATGVEVDVFATATTTASIIANVGSLADPPPVMDHDGAGNFHTHVDTPAVGELVTLPATVLVSASSPGNNPTNIFTNLVDEVTISMAAYDVFSDRLLIRARSSDQVNTITLTAKDQNGNMLGDLVDGMMLLTGVTLPPSSVKVESSAGGSADKDVLILDLAP